MFDKIIVNGNSLSPTGLAVLRYLLASAAAFFVGKGVMTDDVAAQGIGAAVVVVNTLIGAYVTWRNNEQKKTMEPFVPDRIATTKAVNTAIKSPLFVGLLSVLLAVILLSGCAGIKMNTDKGVLTLQTAWRGAQDAAYLCITRDVPVCVTNKDKIIDIVHEGQGYESTLYTAHLVGASENQADAAQNIVNLIAQLAAIGVKVN